MFGDVRHKLEYTICKKKKLDATTIRGHFIGYPAKSKGYMFYYPTHSTRIVETGNAQFIENGETRGSEASRNVEIKLEYKFL